MGSTPRRLTETNSLRLLLVTTVFPTPWEPTKGPFNLGLVRALNAAGHETRVVAPVPWTVLTGLAVPTGGRPPGARVPRELAVFPTYWFTPRMLRAAYGWFMWRSIRRVTLPLLSSFRPDAVLGYWAHPDCEAAVRAARAADVPGVVIVGGSDVLLLTRDPARRKSILSTLNRADAVLGVGEALCCRLTEMGVAPERIRVLARSVDPSLFCPGDAREAIARLALPPGPPLVLWVGRMVPVKGLDTLLTAISILRQQGVALRLALVGDGPLRRRLQQQVAASGCDDVVLFPGPVAHERLPDWYRAADLTVLSSISEGTPNVLLESLACGTPFVGTAVGSVAALALDEADLVSPGDARALAAALTRRLARPLAPVRVPLGRSVTNEAVGTVVAAVADAVKRRRELHAARASDPLERER